LLNSYTFRQALPGRESLGATGLTFYDDDVTRFFSPHAEGKSAIFLVAVGHGVKRKA